MSKIFRSGDARAVALLVLLWMIFFWRIFTPITADQASFKEGDFSGQFVAFAVYQADRLAAGEIPLWNPYNNGGLPFVADPQAAVFYPPRLLTIAASSLSGGFSYAALQWEAILHVLAYSLLMYAFLRRLLQDHPGSVYGAFIGAVVAAYGGFIAGYPMLQLAILEGAIWLPLSALGILEATRSKLKYPWLALAGFALGLSWLAGHSQTSWLVTYLMLAWLAYRVYAQRLGWQAFFGGAFLFGIITFGVTAVTLLPGIEYLRLASRSDLGYPAKGNGFPLQDVLQLIFPGSVSLFSPLYVGIASLLLIFAAVRYRMESSRFWLGTAGIGLLLSFGANTAFYPALYNLLPGLSFFRGQERAALIVALSLAALAGLGAAKIAAWSAEDDAQPLRRAEWLLLALISGLTALLVAGWFGQVGEGFGAIVGTAVFSTALIVVSVFLLRRTIHQPKSWLLAVLALVIVFDLFSLSMDSDAVYDDIPAAAQLPANPPPLVQAVLDDETDQPFRVDGFRGLEANYGSLYGILDIRGISPLFLQSAQQMIYRDYVNNPLAWELFAVRYIYSERDSFGSVETQVIAEGQDSQGYVYLHEILDPRPFAHLAYQADIVDSDEFARALLDDPRYDPRNSIILLDDPGRELPDSAPENASAEITEFAPEAFTIEVDTPENAILSLAHVDYPGWQATLDGEPVPILRAYSTLTAVAVPIGEYTIRFTYDPLSYRIGAILSLFTWGGLAILAAVQIFRRIRRSSED